MRCLTSKGFMILAIIAFILPPLCIMCIGTLLIIIPQRESLALFRHTQRKFRPGTIATTTSGLQGFIVSSTRTHVIITTEEGQKHEFLKHLVTPHETGV